MENTKKISVKAIISFFASLVLCAVVISLIIAYKPGSEKWYTSPGDLTLIIMGILACLFFSMVVQNRSAMKQMKEYFDNMAITDTLTCVYNRRYIDENINVLIKSISRSHGLLTLMIAEIDYFKNYNETYGFKKGDNCLKIVANILSQSIKRDNDFVARYGAKEFMIVLPNTDEKGAHIIADRLLKNVRECGIPHEKSDVSDSITISIGVTTGGKDFSHNGDDYISTAKEALQTSAKDGHNRYTFLKMENE